jgi:hypothetical protein
MPKIQVEPWLMEPTQQVLELTASTLESVDNEAFGPGGLRAMLVSSQPWRDAAAGRRTMAVHLPLLVYNGLRDETARAIPLAASLLALEAGIYALDAVMDAEIAPPLDAWSPGSVVLGAVSFMTFVSQSLLLRLDVQAEALRQLQGHLSAGLAEMSVGQALDLATKRHPSPDSQTIELAIRGKTGARRALYAAMAAKLAGASTDQVERLHGYGMSLGAARQLHSDLVDLFGSNASRDLAAGIRTLPLALYLEEAAPQERTDLLALLDDSRDPQRQARVQAILLKSGSLRKCLLRKEMHCRRALRLLNDACLTPLAATELRDAVQLVSLTHA